MSNINDTEKELNYINQLIDKFDELMFLKNFNNNIYVIKNYSKEITEEDLETNAKNTKNLVKITKIPSKYKELINPKDVTGSSMFLIEIVDSAFNSPSKLDTNQLKALLYFALRRITFQGRLRDKNMNDWLKIIHGLGKNFDHISSSCPDILDDNFSWKKLMGEYYNLLDDTFNNDENKN